jgi:hypothetical protein
MGLLDILKPKTTNPFELGDYYDLQGELDNFSPKELGRVPDTRDLSLSPMRIADGVAITREGYLSAVLRIGTINFALATSEEQEQIIAGYHGVLCQLAGLGYQIKVQVSTADLEPLVQQVDFALRGVANPQMHRLAIQYKQFLREELPRKVPLMERRNYFIVAVHAAKLIQMVRSFEEETGKPCRVMAGLGWKETYPIRNRQREKRKAISLADQRKGQAQRHRHEQEMEQQIYREFQSSLRKLQGEVNLLITGLSANGLAVRQLNDWELTELYASYTRPELAKQVRQAQSKNYQQEQVALAGTGWYGQEARPSALSRLLGEQSSTAVATDTPQTATYREAFKRSGERTSDLFPDKLASSLTAGNPDKSAKPLPKATPLSRVDSKSASENLKLEPTESKRGAVSPAGIRRTTTPRKA